jgi:hypothetical protein
MKQITFYLDFISPYAYLAFERLPVALQGQSYHVVYKPVLFAGLLKHHGQLGPAEIPGKREWTYRQVLWLAREHGIALQMPAAHPFNPLQLLRLAADCGDQGLPNRWVVSFGAGILFADAAQQHQARRLSARLLVCTPGFDLHLHCVDFLLRQEDGRHRPSVRRSRRLRGQWICKQQFISLSVGAFALYIGIAIWARAGSTSEFYAAGGTVNPVMNGMATAADWMSAASFISMAGLIANMGYGGGCS